MKKIVTITIDGPTRSGRTALANLVGNAMYHRNIPCDVDDSGPRLRDGFLAAALDGMMSDDIEVLVKTTGGASKDDAPKAEAKSGDFWIVEVGGRVTIARKTAENCYVLPGERYPVRASDPAFQRAIRRLDLGMLIDGAIPAPRLKDLAFSLWTSRGGSPDGWDAQSRIEQPAGSKFTECWRDAGAVMDALKMRPAVEPAGRQPTAVEMGSGDSRKRVEYGSTIPPELRDLLAALVDVCKNTAKWHSKELSEEWSDQSENYVDTGPGTMPAALRAFADLALQIGSDGDRYAALLRGMLEQQPPATVIPGGEEPEALRLTGGAVAFLRRSIQPRGFGIVCNGQVMDLKLKNSEFMLSELADCIVDISDGGFRVVKVREVGSRPMVEVVGQDRPASTDTERLKPIPGEASDLDKIMSDIAYQVNGGPNTSGFTLPPLPPGIGKVWRDGGGMLSAVDVDADNRRALNNAAERQRLTDALTTAQRHLIEFYQRMAS